MGLKRFSVGRANAVLMAALQGYAGCGLAGAAAAVYCAVTAAPPELAGLLVPAAVLLGERLERGFLQALTLWRVRRDVQAGRGAGGAVDRAARTAGAGQELAAYDTFIRRYCGHDGVWRDAGMAIRTVGIAKGGGWWRAETFDGRVYDLDLDRWL